MLQARLKNRTCKVCGNTFKALKSNASYCSNSCKQQAQRDRREAIARGITIEQARVTIITPEQRKVLRTKNCKVCGKPFEYRSSKGIFCSDACQKKDQRLREKNNTSLLRETVTAQSGMIKTQGVVINTVLPDYLFDSNYHSEQKITEKLSAETGKDLTECKRPDGKHLYTKQDIFILLAKISKVNWGLPAQPQVADLLPWFNADRITRSIIADFERRFECKFDEIKRANSDIRPESNEEYISLMKRYENLKYSR